MDPVLHAEKVPGDAGDELRIGVASWDEKKKGGEGKALALKYAWLDKNGKVARGGELPVSTIAQSIEFVVATGTMEVAAVLEAAARGCRRLDVAAEADG